MTSFDISIYLLKRCLCSLGVFGWLLFLAFFFFFFIWLFLGATVEYICPWWLNILNSERKPSCILTYTHIYMYEGMLVLVSIWVCVYFSWLYKRETLKIRFDVINANVCKNLQHCTDMMVAWWMNFSFFCFFFFVPLTKQEEKEKNHSLFMTVCLYVCCCCCWCCCCSLQSLMLLLLSFTVRHAKLCWNF